MGDPALHLVSASSTRRCPRCELDLAAEKFHGDDAAYCIECWSGYQQERAGKAPKPYDWAARERRKRVAQAREKAQEGHTVCYSCENTKPFSEFQNKTKKTGYCTTCRSRHRKGRRDASPISKLRSLLKSAKSRSKRAGRAFDLSPEDLLAMWDAQGGRCWYTSVPMNYDGGRSPGVVSLDRVDNTEGYVHTNVVLCCLRVNEMKRNMSLDEFYTWCELLLEHRGE